MVPPIIHCALHRSMRSLFKPWPVTLTKRNAMNYVFGSNCGRKRGGLQPDDRHLCAFYSQQYCPKCVEAIFICFFYYTRYRQPLSTISISWAAAKSLYSKCKIFSVYTEGVSRKHNCKSAKQSPTPPRSCLQLPAPCFCGQEPAAPMLWVTSHTLETPPNKRDRCRADHSDR